MLPSEMEELHKKQSESRLRVQSDEALVIAMARMLVSDWKQGKAPGTTEMIMLAAAVEQHRGSQKDFLELANTVVAAYDAQVGRVRP